MRKERLLCVLLVTIVLVWSPNRTGEMIVRPALVDPVAVQMVGKLQTSPAVYGNASTSAPQTVQAVNIGSPQTAPMVHIDQPRAFPAARTGKPRAFPAAHTGEPRALRAAYTGKPPDLSAVGHWQLGYDVDDADGAPLWRRKTFYQISSRELPLFSLTGPLSVMPTSPTDFLTARSVDARRGFFGGVYLRRGEGLPPSAMGSVHFDRPPDGSLVDIPTPCLSTNKPSIRNARPHAALTPCPLLESIIAAPTLPLRAS